MPEYRNISPPSTGFKVMQRNPTGEICTIASFHSTEELFLKLFKDEDYSVTFFKFWHVVGDIAIFCHISFVVIALIAAVIAAAAVIKNSICIAHEVVVSFLRFSWNCSRICRFLDSSLFNLVRLTFQPVLMSWKPFFRQTYKTSTHSTVLCWRMSY